MTTETRKLRQRDVPIIAELTEQRQRLDQIIRATRDQYYIGAGDPDDGLVLIATAERPEMYNFLRQQLHAARQTIDNLLVTAYGIEP